MTLAHKQAALERQQRNSFDEQRHCVVFDHDLYLRTKKSMLRDLFPIGEMRPYPTMITW